MIVFPCPHCNQKVNVKREAAGRKGTCPRCGQPIQVPAKASSTKSPARRAAAEPEAPRWREAVVAVALLAILGLGGLAALLIHRQSRNREQPALVAKEVKGEPAFVSNMPTPVIDKTELLRGNPPRPDEQPPAEPRGVSLRAEPQTPAEGYTVMKMPSDVKRDIEAEAAQEAQRQQQKLRADFDRLMAQAQEHASAKRYTDAVRIYNEALQLVPGDVAAMKALGEAKQALETEVAQEAQRLKEQKLRADFDRLMAQAQEQASAQRYADAVRLYTEALQLVSGDAAAMKGISEAKQALETQVALDALRLKEQQRLADFKVAQEAQRQQELKKRADLDRLMAQAQLAQEAQRQQQLKMLADRRVGELKQVEPPVSARVEARSPFGRQHVLDFTATIVNNALEVRVDETRHYASAIAPSYPFYDVMEGLGSVSRSGRLNRDTDSLQVAVRWTDTVGGGGTDVGHKTNAVPWIDPGSKSLRAKGATWERGGADKEQWLLWKNGDIPPSAKHLDIVLVYTDVLSNAPDEWGENNSGDLPVILGSFSADLKGKKWEMIPIPEGKPWQTYFPNPNSYPAIYEEVKRRLKDKTGYDLKPRPPVLLQTINRNETWIYRPGLTREFDRQWIRNQIRRAVVNGEIHNEHDTGFDIIPRQ